MSNPNVHKLYEEICERHPETSVQIEYNAYSRKYSGVISVRTKNLLTNSQRTLGYPLVIPSEEGKSFEILMDNPTLRDPRVKMNLLATSFGPVFVKRVWLIEDNDSLILEIRDFVGRIEFQRKIDPETEFYRIVDAPEFGGVRDPRVFIAEPKRKENFMGYWESDSGVPDPFAYQPSLGEKLDTLGQPILFILDVDEPYELKAVPTEGVPAFPIKAENLLFYGVYGDDPRFGLSVCNNRSCQLFCRDLKTDTIRLLTPDFYYAACPTYEKGTLYFVYHEATFYEHLGPLHLGSLKISNIEDELVFNCLATNLFVYCPEILVTATDLLINTTFDGGNSVLKLNLETLEQERRPNYKLLGRPFMVKEEDVAVAVQSDLSCTSAMEIWSIQDMTSRAPLFGPYCSNPFHNRFNINKVASRNCEGFLCTPWEALDNKSLIVCLHGGPHTAALNTFSTQLCLWVELGFNVLLPNYRGSTSYSVEHHAELRGNAGHMAADDVLELLAEVRSNYQKVGLFGGSYGGYLVGMLMADNRISADAGALWNPVTNVAANTAASDIPEWGMAEYLADPKFRTLTGSEMAQLYEQSPQARLKLVEAPLLLVLGLADLRVPANTNGLDYYRHLRAAGKNVTCYTYPGEGHSLSGPRAQAHAVCKIADFFLEHLT